MKGTCPVIHPPMDVSVFPHLIAKNLFEIAPVGTRVVVRDGNWNIHELQQKPSGMFRTVHKPAAQVAGANSASSGKKELVKSETSVKKMPPPCRLLENRKTGSCLFLRRTL